MQTNLKKLSLNQETIKNILTDSVNIGSTPSFSCGGPHCELTNAINCHTRVCGAQ